MERIIRVTGKGKLAVKPDRIRLYITKESTYKEYESVLKNSTQDTQQLKDMFEKIGFERNELKTLYFNIDTKYESYQDIKKTWKQRFVGYTYTHRMKIEFDADNKRLGQVLYALAHCSLNPEFFIEYTVADVEKCKNELLQNAIKDSMQKAQVLAMAANVKLGEIQSIDYSWQELEFVTKPIREMSQARILELDDMDSYAMDIEADDIDVTDNVTVVWSIL